MLDYKTNIIKRYALHLSGTQIAKDLGYSKSGVNDFLKRFEECERLPSRFQKVSPTMEYQSSFMTRFPVREAEMNPLYFQITQKYFDK